MSALRNKAVQTTARLPKASRSVRSYSTGQHGKTGDEVHHFAGSSTEHGHHHAGPQNESLGLPFFLVLGAIPVTIGVYTLSRPSEDGKPAGLTKMIDSYSYYKDRWAARNTLHTKMIERAAFDRNLFNSDPGSAHIELKFPEIFNTGSPYNVSAGQGARDLDKVVEHYRQKNAEENRKIALKLEAIEQQEASAENKK